MFKWTLRLVSIPVCLFLSGLGFNLRRGMLDAGSATPLLGLVLLFGGIALLTWVWFGWDRTKVDLGSRQKKPWELEP